MKLGIKNTLLRTCSGPVIGFVLGMGGLVVGATLFSGSMFFALTFAAPLLLGASIFSMLGFWTFGAFSVIASLALPALMLGVRTLSPSILCFGALPWSNQNK